MTYTNSAGETVTISLPRTDVYAAILRADLAAEDLEETDAR